jgi:hypothetical protein
VLSFAQSSSVSSFVRCSIRRHRVVLVLVASSTSVHIGLIRVRVYMRVVAFQ